MVAHTSSRQTGELRRLHRTVKPSARRMSVLRVELAKLGPVLNEKERYRCFGANASSRLTRKTCVKLAYV